MTYYKSAGRDVITNNLTAIIVTNKPGILWYSRICVSPVGVDKSVISGWNRKANKHSHNIRSEATGKWQLSSDYYRTGRQRTVDHEHLPEVLFVDSFPNSIKNALSLDSKLNLMLFSIPSILNY
ncbi:hypothetical protein J6590_085686 [Homalodisca vitripennis]|nr:hypothetical protein J6590_085686 [Homalodisca vitripennis]